MSDDSRMLWRDEVVLTMRQPKSVQDFIATRTLAIGDGYRAKNSELSPSGLPFARAGNIDGGFHFAGADCFPVADLQRVGDKVSRPGDVVFTSKGTVGRFAFVTENTPRFVFSPQLCYWRSLDQTVIDSRWLYYWMNGPEFWSQASGVKGQTDMADYVSLSDQRRMTITLPEIDVQRAIAAVLGALDDKIEQNRRTGEALERLARATFKAWFVDFEPVRAKADGAKSFPGMPFEAFAALPTTFKPSPLGLIPDGWTVRALGDIATQGREQVNPASSPFEIFEHYSIPAFDNQKKPSLAAGSTIKSCKFAVPQNCMLLSKLNPRIPRVWMPARAGGLRRICSTEFVVLVPREERVLAFLYCLLREDGFRDALAQGASGTSNSHQRVTPQLILSQMLAYAPEPVLDAFAAVMSPLLDLVLAHRAETDKLAEVRDYLLPRLISGEVRVRDGCANGG